MLNPGYSTRWSLRRGSTKLRWQSDIYPYDLLCPGHNVQSFTTIRPSRRPASALHTDHLFLEVYRSGLHSRSYVLWSRCIDTVALNGGVTVQKDNDLYAI